MANSFTGVVFTGDQFATVESLTVGVSGSNFTGFTSGKKYYIQVKDYAEFKVSDAIFELNDKRILYFTAGADDLYIKANTLDYKGCRLTILEEEEASA